MRSGGSWEFLANGSRSISFKSTKLNPRLLVISRHKTKFYTEQFYLRWIYCQLFQLPTLNNGKINTCECCRNIALSYPQEFLKIARPDMKLISRLSIIALQWAFGKPWINLYLTFTLPSSVLLMAQVLKIHSGPMHETKPQISQNTKECHFLSPTTIIHPALTEHQLLYIGLTSLSASAAEQIYSSLIDLLMWFGVYGCLWISRVGAEGRW